MVRRMVKALAKRVAEADDVDLAEMVEIRRVLEDAIEQAVIGQKAAGRSWAEIAAGLGTTRQYAQKRYGRVTDRAS